MVVALFQAGAQVPLIPLVEVLTNGDVAVPAHTGATCVNVGVTFGLTVMVILAVVAHSPAVGVKVYVVVALLFNAGLQVPLMPLLEVVGNALSVPPAQIGTTCVKVGVIFGFTVTVMLAVVAQEPAVGVKV